MKFNRNFFLRKSETENKNLIINFLNFYKEIGIDLSINNKTSNRENSKSKKNVCLKNKEKNIRELEQSFKNFDGCNLKKTSAKFVNFFGNTSSKVLIIDGPPDEKEDRAGSSFVSDKGELFEKMLNAIKLKKNDIFFVKSIPWRPPGNRYPSIEEIKNCRPFIINLINLIQPKIIVCLGEVPTNQIFETNESIIKTRGKWCIYKSNELNYEIFVLPTLNISHLLIRPDLKRYAWEDIKLLRDKIEEIV